MTDHTNSCDHCARGDHSQRYEVCPCCRAHEAEETR